MSDPQKLENFRDFFAGTPPAGHRLCGGRDFKPKPEFVEWAKENLPLEFGLHSFRHDQKEPDSQEEIDKACQAFIRFFGRPPLAYRAPNGLISQEGLIRLARAGFAYDSSVFPSLRLDEYGFNHLHLPCQPFWVETAPPILEIPFASFTGLRLTISLSFIKLLGWPLYSFLLKTLPLPETLVIDFHPYDLYIHECLPNIQGWKKWAHGRNAENGLLLLGKLVDALRAKGYEFVHLSQILRPAKRPRLPAPGHHQKVLRKIDKIIVFQPQSTL